MKKTEIGKATYMENDMVIEVWSYNTLILRIYPKLKEIDLYPKHDFNQTTGRHLNEFFTNKYNMASMQTGARRKEAIETGSCKSGKCEYKVNEIKEGMRK